MLRRLRRDLRVSANRLRRKGEPPGSGLDRSEGLWEGVASIPWIIAALCVIGGIVTLIRGAVLNGIVLIIVGLLIGPGGASILLIGVTPFPVKEADVGRPDRGAFCVNDRSSWSWNSG